MNQPFNKNSFFGLEKKQSAKDMSRFLILPVPYESTTTYGHGTVNGPKAIIDASAHLEVYDEELQNETYKLGIHTLPFLKPTSAKPQDMQDALLNCVKKEIAHDKIIISLGGEHSISSGIIKPFKKKYPDLSVLHLDAHADLRETFYGSPHSHACAARRILDICPVVSCGIRSLSQKEADFALKTKHNIFLGKTALNEIEKIIPLLSGNVYITLDVDVLDPSVMPSTGTPEPDGWTWRETCDFLKQIIFVKNIVGIDIVELAPISNNHAPDFSVAKLIYRLMGYISLKRNWIKSPKK